MLRHYPRCACRTGTASSSASRRRCKGAPSAIRPGPAAFAVFWTFRYRAAASSASRCLAASTSAAFSRPADEVIDDILVFEAMVGDAVDVDLVRAVAAAGEAD